MEMQTGLFILMTVSEEPCNQVDDKIGRAAMTRVLNLRNVLELVNDTLNDRSFTH